MKALVIGAGGVGRAIANIASRRSFISSMVIADRNFARAEEAVARVKDARFSAAEVNAAELEDIRALIRKAKPDVVINAVDPRFVMPIFLACEIENTNYIDMAMSLSRPHPHYPNTETGVKLGDEQFARDWNWGERGIYALVGMGIDASRLETIGYGETKPTADNTTAAGRSANRRAQFERKVQLRVVE